MLDCGPIGFVKSTVTEAVDQEWGSVLSELVIDEGYAPGLTGISSFSHIIVVFQMHESTWDPATDLVRRPQGRSDMPLLGIFAQRARHRPNPIGITAVRLLGVNGNILSVQGLDAINGTPILDVKPYFPQYDRVETPSLPDWVGRLMAGYL